MGEPISAQELSPLDQIRVVEAEITRKLVAAREASDRSIADARVQAALIKKQAHESGEQKGRIRYKEIVSEAEEEAQAIVVHAHNHAADLRRKGSTHMGAAVQEAIRCVLGVKGDATSNER